MRKKTNGFDQLQLDKEAYSLMSMENGYMTQLCSSWMHFFFELVGDRNPCNNEIHLEPMQKVDLWKEYCSDIHFLLCEEKALNYSGFLDVWRNNFPHVSIRKYKAVTGKCSFCAVLSDLRRRHHSRSIR